MEAKNLQPTAVTFNSLLDAVARCREMQHVPRLLRLIKQYGVKPDLITFSTICKGYCQVNDLTKAFETFEILREQVDEAYRGDEGDGHSPQQRDLLDLGKGIQC